MTKNYYKENYSQLPPVAEEGSVWVTPKCLHLGTVAGGCSQHSRSLWSPLVPFVGLCSRREFYCDSRSLEPFPSVSLKGI